MEARIADAISRIQRTLGWIEKGDDAAARDGLVGSSVAVSQLIGTLKPSPATRLIAAAYDDLGRACDSHNLGYGWRTHDLCQLAARALARADFFLAPQADRDALLDEIESYLDGEADYDPPGNRAAFLLERVRRAKAGLPS